VTETPNPDAWREREWVLCAAKEAGPKPFAEAVRRELSLEDLDDEVATGWLLFGILVITLVGPVLAYAYNLRPAMRLRKRAREMGAAYNDTDPECTTLAMTAEMRRLLLRRAQDDKDEVLRTMRLLRRSGALLVEAHKATEVPEALRQLAADEPDPVIAATYERRLEGRRLAFDAAALQVEFERMFANRTDLLSATADELKRLADALEAAMPSA
jgi:hypothetical protein